jgi:hypothetical protein
LLYDQAVIAIEWAKKISHDRPGRIVVRPGRNSDRVGEKNIA